MLKTPRHRAKQFEIGPIRELGREDLAVLAVPRTPISIKSISDNHHRIARAVASGMAMGDVAAVCGISYNRVYSLKADPAFTELVAHYRSVITAEWAQQDTVIEFLRSNSLKAQAMLSDKLDAASEAGEFLPTRDLLGIAELGLDRTGYGKVQKNLNVNVDFAAKLEAARSRARAPQVIDHSPPIAAQPPRQSGPPDAHAPTPPAAQPLFRRRI